MLRPFFQGPDIDGNIGIADRTQRLPLPTQRFDPHPDAPPPPDRLSALGAPLPAHPIKAGPDPPIGSKPALQGQDLHR